MKSEKESCFFCKKDIDLKKTDSYVSLKVDNNRIFAHTSHHGVMEEYDYQLGVKKVKNER